MNERLKEAIVDFRDKMKLLDNDSSYPFIQFPDSLISSINKFENKSEEDILEICRDIDDYEHDYLWHKEKPIMPQAPQRSSIPSHYSRTFLKVDMAETLFRAFYWGCLFALLGSITLVLILMLISCFTDISFTYAHFTDTEAIVILSVLFIVGFIIKLFFKKEKSYSTQRIPYSKEEQEKMQQEEDARYEIVRQKYDIDLANYEVKLSHYYDIIEEQNQFIENHASSITAALFKSNVLYSDRYSTADDVPQMEESEKKLFECLMDRIPNAVKVDTEISGYFPDLVVSASNDSDEDVYLDIEIDEPYEMTTRKEIHYLGCGDDDRNQRICDCDWFVVRFSEKQVKTECDTCVNIIENLREFIKTGDIEVLDKIITQKNSITDRRWTKEEARLMALRNYRRTY